MLRKKILNLFSFSIFNKNTTFIALFCVFSNFLNAAGPSKDDLESSSKALSVRVYLLKGNQIDDILKEVAKKKPIQYTYRDCQKNLGCKWISRPKTKTAPHFWSLIKEGTGIKLDETEDDLNTGEHWLYYIPSSKTKSLQNFAVIFGQGEFFQRKHQDIDDSFGKRIVLNLVEKPKSNQESGLISGKPFNKKLLFSEVKGLDYCSVHLKLNSLKELIQLCDTLYRYSRLTLRETYDQVKKIAQDTKKEIVDVPENELAIIQGKEEGEDDDLEGDEEVTYEVEGKRKTAVRVFGKYVTFEGLQDYINNTKSEISKLIDKDKTHKLPAFNKDSLKDIESDVPIDESDSATQADDKDNEDDKKSKKKVIDWEGRYNKKVAEEKGYLLLDKKCVVNVEVCDFWISDRRELVHVKIGTDSHNLNHLFGQGYASADLLTHMEFSTEILFDLLRKDIALKATDILANELQKNQDLWKLFDSWRKKETNKVKIEKKYETKKTEKTKELLRKIDEDSVTSTVIQEGLNALKEDLSGEKQKAIEKLKKKLSKSDKKEELKAFLQELLPKIKGPLLLELTEFPKGKKEFKAFLDELKEVKDLELNPILSFLESYRADLLEGHLESCWVEIKPELQKPSLTLKEVLTKFNEAYRQKLLNKRIKATSFSSEQLESLYEDLTLQILGEQILQGFVNTDATSEKKFQVVYAVVTDKDEDDLNLLPLGARINFLRTVEDIENKPEMKNRFKVVLRVIHDETPDKKPLRKKATVTAVKKTKKTGVIARSSKSSQPSPPEKHTTTGQDLKGLFQTAEALTNLDLSTVQKLQHICQNQGVLEYLSCPTIGDGDCFFHAAFTDFGDSVQTVQGKAASMRTLLCDTIQQGQYVDDLRHLVYEHYIWLLAKNSDHAEVPGNIKQQIQTKNEYIAMYNSMKRFGVPINDEITPNPENRFPVDEIEALITPDHIKTYMEQFRSVGGDETYIPFRPDMLCPVDILATISEKRLNIFTFNTSEKKLQFSKTAGTIGNFINILQAGDHFVRLYLPTEGDNSLHQCEQIWTNYRTFIAKHLK